MLEMIFFATGLFGAWGPGPVPAPQDSVDAWVQGFFLSLFVGGVVTDFCRYEGHRRIENLPERRGSVPGWITGLLERTFFTLATAVSPPATIPAMIGWLGVKLAANWQRAKPTEATRSAAFLAVAVGLLAMLFSLLGGLLCRKYFGAPIIGIKLF